VSPAIFPIKRHATGTLHRRVRRLLARRGRLPDDEAGGRDPFAAQAPLFASAVAASLQGRVALGPRAGELLRRLRSAATATATGPRCARLEGFSLHADVAVPARRRDQLERLVRYLVRPPLALDRWTESPGGTLTCSRGDRHGATQARFRLFDTPLPEFQGTRFPECLNVDTASDGEPPPVRARRSSHGCAVGLALVPRGLEGLLDWSGSNTRST
jgi:hypothetical protein